MESCSSRESDVHSIDVRRYCTVDSLDRSNNRPTDGRTRRTARRLEGRKRRLMDMFYSDGLRRAPGRAGWGAAGASVDRCASTAALEATDGATAPPCVSRASACVISQLDLCAVE